MTGFCRWEPVARRSLTAKLSVSLSVIILRGTLTHHRVGANSISFAPPQAAGLIRSVVPPFPTKSTTLWEPFCGGGMPAASCALRGGCRFLRKATDNAIAPASAAVIVYAIGQIPSLQPTLFFQPPAQTCHRQLCRRNGRASCPSIFSFTKKKQKKERTR